MSEVKQEGQKAGLAEQGSPPELRQKKKVYGLQKQGQDIQDDYRDAVHHSRKRIHIAKAQLELKLVSMMVGNKQGRV